MCDENLLSESVWMVFSCLTFCFVFVSLQRSSSVDFELAPSSLDSFCEISRIDSCCREENSRVAGKGPKA